MVECDTSTVDGSPVVHPNRRSLGSEPRSGDRQWKLWPLFFIAMCVFTAALAITAIAIAAGKEEKCSARSQAKDTLHDVDFGATRTLRLSGSTREPMGGVRVHLSTGEQIVVDAASVELRSASGQLLQQLALPLIPLSSKAVLQLEHGQALQRQLLEQFPQQRKLMAEQLQVRQLQQRALQMAQAAVLQRAVPLPTATSRGPVQTPSFTGNLHRQQVPKRRLYVRRNDGETSIPETADPLLVSAQGPVADSSNSTQAENTTPGQTALNENATDGFCQAALGGSGKSCLDTAQSGQSPVGAPLPVTATPKPGQIPVVQDIQDKTLSPSPVKVGKNTALTSPNPVSTALHIPQRKAQVGLPINALTPFPPFFPPPGISWPSAPKRNLLATQAVGGMAVMADALAKVGQAMFVGPLSIASTIDAAGALFASPVPPIVSGPLAVGPIKPYLPYYPVVAPRYTYGCGSFDPHCLYMGVY